MFVEPESPDQKEYWQIYEDSLPPLKWWEYPVVVICVIFDLTKSLISNRKNEATKED